MLVGGRASFTVYPSGLAIGPGTELLATAQSGPGHDPGAEGKQAPGLWPGVGCRLGVDYLKATMRSFWCWARTWPLRCR